MSNFRSNFSDLVLLSKEPVLGYIGDKEFKIIPPKLLDYYKTPFIILMSLLEKDVEEIKDLVLGQELKSHYLLFSFILSGVDRSDEVKKLAESILIGLQVIVPDLVFESKMFKIKGEFLDEASFNDIIILIFKMLKKNKIIINPDDDKFTRKEKEMKLKAQRIRRNAKDKGEGGKIEDMLISIIYTFPQYELNDLFELNIYTIYYLFGYVGKISNYEVEKMAYATGNFKKGKKLKYFIEK